jgi:hypothetical protein
MGTSPSGDTPKVTPESDMFKDERNRSREDAQGNASTASRRPQRQPGRLPLPD